MIIDMHEKAPSNTQHFFKYKLQIAYDGTRYSGWQIQPNGVSIQECLQRSISTFCKVPCIVVGSGRTDAGVHARGQIAHFSVPSAIDTYRFLRGVNGMLPLDIRVQDIEEVEANFHACHSAKGKVYYYHLHLGRVVDPFKRLYSWHVGRPIDLSLLQEAAKLLVGKHDFTSFANEAHKGAAASDAVRTIKRIDVVCEPGGVRLEFEGNGFLYKMVRNIVGTLLAVAYGKRLLSDIPLILAAKDRRKGDNAAPPHGLFLMGVFY